MVSKRIVTALGVVAALALPGVSALAAGHSGAGHGGHHGSAAQARGHHGGAHRPTGQRGHGLRQLEGTIVAVDASSLALQPLTSHAVTVTVAISSGTSIVADAGVTSTLAAGEQVHVAARVDTSGGYTAVLVRIQRAVQTKTPTATEAPAATQAPADTEISGAANASSSRAVSRATATPRSGSVTRTDDGQGHDHTH